MATATTTTREVQVQIAYEVLMMEETSKSKADIAKEYGVSPRSVTRYAEKYEEEAMELLPTEYPQESADLDQAFNKEEVVEEEEIVAAPEEAPEEEVVEEQPKPTILEEQKAMEEAVKVANGKKEAKPKVKKEKKETVASEVVPVNPDDPEDRRGRRGKTPQGVKSIKAIVLEILEAHKNAETLIKDNRDSIIAEIEKATKHTRKQAAKYFSGYKKQVGGYQDAE